MTIEPTTAAPPALARVWAGTRLFRPVLFLVIAMLLIFAMTQPVFFTAGNIANVLTAAAPLWVVSMGMTLVVITGGVDLSVGATAALTGIFLAKAVEAGLPAALALPASVVVGAVVGAVANGLFIGWLRLSFFVVTIASMTTITGIVNLWSNSKSFYLTDPLFSQLSGGGLLGIPYPVCLMIVVFALFLYLERRTFFGRDVFAVGGSFSAARLSGIKTTRTIVLVYSVSGALAGVAGVLSSARVGAATPQVDPSLPLLAVAAVLLGGTSLLGGLGSVVGTALGVLFIALLQNGLSIAGIASFWQQVITGVILVAAVLGDRISARRRPSRRQRAADARAQAETRTDATPTATPSAQTQSTGAR
ncbi:MULTISPECIES: ABC transporter permease [Microbacterium]|uniref:ABC transporter permease n=1 Tax=Microbacterium TaxID=33882 RepID=UPI00277F3B39|nr:MULTISPECIES: ABC transporter permease [Microbacterium]MDQ1074147.1 ribose transport system permease protein [Microbacterium sp. SORGH_AS_0969]MDQ1114373.1 ribose transport system permease protein [Microbacterium testaceum]